MNSRPSILQRLAQIFALDVRSLAVFRIAIGGLVLADLAVRASDFQAMYGPQGLAPIAVVRSWVPPSQWSLHFLSGAAWFQASLFVVAAALALALIVGYRTRWATVGSWLLLASLHVRLPIVLNAGDTLLRLLLFWGMFLPLGAAWSVDARRTAPRRPTLIASAGAAAFLVQLAIVYWAAGLGKWNELWLSGNALGQVFAFRYYGEPLGRWLLNYPALTHWLTLSVLALELIGPCLLFMPWGTARLRLALIVAFIGFHLEIAATITVGLFPWVSIVAWLALIPSWVWDRLSARRTDSAMDRSVVPPLAPPFEGGGLAAACCAAAMAVVVYWNVVDLTQLRLPAPIHAAVQQVAGATMLRQSWQVFARPPQFDAIFVYQGRLRDGKLVDLYSGRPLADGSHAALEPNELPNHRWRKLHLRILSAGFAGYRRPLAAYMCRQWNATHPLGEQAVRVDFYCLRQPTAAAAGDDDFVRTNLASIVLDEKWGNFSEALRELGP